MTTTEVSGFPVRDVEFSVGDHTPRYWHSGRRAVTLFFNNLSTLFPHGERFFIRSVAKYRKQVRDPSLLSEVKAFTSQEAIHTREHQAYNDMLRAQGFDIDAIEETVARLLRLPKLTGPLRNRVSLAATAALEHWTGLLAHFVLTDSSV
ncbi:MAG: metal-dependent hydrolase, partial [Myxococcales bacterium]|nr:metal-dependent hydrolase [Myxococcales bacterium]